MAHVILCRRRGPDYEVALHCRTDRFPRDDQQPGTWGLPGGGMEPSEKELSRGKSFPAKDRWYARRRCAVREVIEECGASKDPLPTSDTQPFIQPLGTAPGLCETVKIPRRLLRAALPADIAPPERVRINAVQTNGSYFFVYTLTEADGAYQNWRPRAMKTCGGEHPRWEVNESEGHYGYVWVPLTPILKDPYRPPVPGSDRLMCSWVRAAFRDHPAAIFRAVHESEENGLLEHEAEQQQKAQQEALGQDLVKVQKEKMVMHVKPADVHLCGLHITVTGKGNCALVVNLNAEALGASKSEVHATILYKPEGFNPNGYAVRTMIEFRKRWLQSRGQHPKGGQCSFSLEPWGKQSSLIHGELREFIEAARESAPPTGGKRTLCEHLGCDIERHRSHRMLPHVELH